MESRQTTGLEVRGIVLQVLFRTDMAGDDALQKVEETKDVFRRVPGLQQKYYVRDPATGEMGGVYVFDSRESLERFRASGISQKALRSFKLVGPPAIRVFEIATALFEGKPLAPSAA